MADLQATIEFAVEFYKFYNVDLFQRGWVFLKIINEFQKWYGGCYEIKYESS